MYALLLGLASLSPSVHAQVVTATGVNHNGASGVCLMKKVSIAFALFFACITTNSFAASPEGRYKQGDCIMGNDPLYSWNGQFAKVDMQKKLEELRPVYDWVRKQASTT